MDVKLSKESAYFLSEAKRLRKLLRETQRSFNDINTGDPIVRAELSPEEEYIREVTKKPPCIIIFGSSNPAKAAIVNDLFGKPVLPVLWNETGYKPWRTVRFKQGSRPSVSLSVQGSYELVDSLVGQSGNWSTVPTEDLQIENSDQFGRTPDRASACAILDIKIRNVLLAEGCEIVVAQGLDSRESLEDIYRKCTVDVVPIFIYAVDQPIFSQQEVNQLKELKVIDSSISVFFVRVNRPKEAEFQSIRAPMSPMDKIRDTLNKNNISGSFSKEQRQSYGLSTSQSNNNKPPEIKRKKSNDVSEEGIKESSECVSNSIRISRYLPCELHNKASCPECILADSVDIENMSPNNRRLRVLSLQHSSGSELDEEGSDIDNDHGDAQYSSMETQVSAGQPTAPRPDSTHFESKPTSSESSAKPSTPLKHRHNDSTISLAGDDIHREFALSLFQQLLDCNYLSVLPPSRLLSVSSDTSGYEVCDSELAEKFENFTNFEHFFHQQLQKALINTVSLLNIVHSRCLHSFILTAFDMQRDMQVTPRKLEYAKSKEKELYQNLLQISDKKQDEIKAMIEETVEVMTNSVLDKAEEYDFIGVDIPESGDIQSAKDLKICTGQIQQLVLEHLNSSIATKLLNSMDILKDSYTGVLTRCLESLEKSESATPESVRTTLALREILNSAYQVEITVSAGSSLLRMLYEKMKQLMHAMTWRNLAHIDNPWKRKVASEMLDTLSSHRLARSICSQIKERLKQSHESFESALRQLQHHHSGRLEKTEEQRLKVRKVHAPRVARLALESISMKDYIVYGMPVLGPEIGRGQYGVVYSCDKWAGRGPCAIKSVVPPDDKHWNDLALEFYYTKNVPEHPRIVALRGSVIDYAYGGGSSPAVLLIMDRLQRDLYAAIKANLDWLGRLQVAIDVVEGIRFLHSQGLVHRDIKLKNVLLDKKNRGLVTDLGFCKPEAMMSGSIVGTPIHMAPELFSGKYDNSVDVYAFGILFWYVCAGHVRLPYAFEQCTNKEMLWTSVKRGVRPERLQIFDPECWAMMQTCWAGDSEKRPLLGDIQPQLCGIFERFRKDPSQIKHRKHKHKSSRHHHHHHREHRDGR